MKRGFLGSAKPSPDPLFISTRSGGSGRAAPLFIPSPGTLRQRRKISAVSPKARELHAAGWRCHGKREWWHPEHRWVTSTIRAHRLMVEDRATAAK